MPTHRIHLKGPWQYQWLGTADQESPSPPAGRVKMPADGQSLFAGRSGRARFSRRFHSPTNLDPHERVLIVIEDVAGTAEIRLNDRELGNVSPETPSGRFDVTGALRPMNELVVEIALDTWGPTASRLWSAVAIEIESS